MSWEKNLEVFTGKDWDQALKESLLTELGKPMTDGKPAPAPKGTEPGTTMKKPDSKSPMDKTQGDKDIAAKKTLSDPAQPQDQKQNMDKAQADQPGDATKGAEGGEKGAAPPGAGPTPPKASNPQAVAQKFQQQPASPLAGAMPNPSQAPGQPPASGTPPPMPPKTAAPPGGTPALGQPQAPPGGAPKPPAAIPQEHPLQGTNKVQAPGMPGAPVPPGGPEAGKPQPSAAGKPPVPGQPSPQGAMKPPAPTAQPAPQAMPQPAVPSSQPPQPAPMGPQAQQQPNLPQGQQNPPQTPPGMPGQPQMQPGLPPGQQNPMQPGMPGAVPGMQGAQPGMVQQPGQAIPQAAKTVQLVLRDEMEAARATEWLKAMGLGNTQTNGNRVLSFVASPEDMTILTRTAAAFGLEMSGNQLPH